MARMSNQEIIDRRILLHKAIWARRDHENKISIRNIKGLIRKIMMVRDPRPVNSHFMVLYEDGIILPRNRSDRIRLNVKVWKITWWTVSDPDIDDNFDMSQLDSIKEYVEALREVREEKVERGTLDPKKAEVARIRAIVAKYTS